MFFRFEGLGSGCCGCRVWPHHVTVFESGPRGQKSNSLVLLEFARTNQSFCAPKGSCEGSVDDCGLNPGCNLGGRSKRESEVLGLG